MSDKFPLEKILTVTPTEYCSSMKKELRNYEMRGVHIDDTTQNKKLISAFQEKVPQEAEAVVSFRYAVAVGIGSCQYASGTALIPKSGQI